MIATESKNLEEGVSVTLDSNARSIMIEVLAGSAAGGIQVMTSHDGTQWHNVGEPITYDHATLGEETKLVAYDDSSENFLQKVKVVGLVGNATAKIFFGRSK